MYKYTFEVDKLAHNLLMNKSTGDNKLEEIIIITILLLEKRRERELEDKKTVFAFNSSLLLENTKNYSFFLSRRKAMETRWKFFKDNSSFVVLFDSAGEKTA
jgi:hypothetical protein